LYFDREHRFFSWQSIYVYQGYWTADWRITRLTLGNRTKWLVIRLFCRWYLTEPTFNNCVVADSLDRLVGEMRNPQRLSGNPLGLGSRKIAPLDLPQGPIDVDALRRAMSSSKQ
jgi:hypothetical protein